MLRKTKPIKRKVKKLEKKSNPAWLDKLLGRTSKAGDSINITTNEGVIILKGKKYVELGKELNDILENTRKDLSIEFHPFDKKGKSYNLNRTSYGDVEEDTELNRARRSLRRGSFDRLPSQRA